MVHKVTLGKNEMAGMLHGSVVSTVYCLQDRGNPDDEDLIFAHKTTVGAPGGQVEFGCAGARGMGSVEIDLVYERRG